MADINAYLREAINGPAPQHKVAGRNQFEISEGSDGATHTKIVDVDGNPLSSVPVEDKAVKAELEEIKATQAEILDRLDGTFDTRLTGSNVEEVETHKAIAIRDTEGHSSHIFDIGHIGGEKYLHVYNGTNEPMEIRVFGFPKNSSQGVSKANTVPANAPSVLTGEDVLFLGLPIQRILVRATAEKEPTSGTFSAWIEGARI